MYLFARRIIRGVIKEVNMRKQMCQSCSMPLAGKNNGTEKDGTLSQKYCNLCYKDGAFIDPDMTLEQMKEITDKVLKEKGWGRIRRWLAVGYIAKLERWKK